MVQTLRVWSFRYDARRSYKTSRTNHDQGIGSIQESGPVIGWADPYIGYMRQLLIIGGLMSLILGIVWPWLGRIGLGHLPGDIQLRRPGFTFYFPLASSLVVSIVLSVVFSVVLWLFRR